VAYGFPFYSAILQQKCRETTETCHPVNDNLYHPLLNISPPLRAEKHDRIKNIEKPLTGE